MGVQSPVRTDVEILVVDDDRQVLEVIVGNLEEKFPTFRFLQADSGNAALALIGERPPDMVLLDLRMPGLNGFALTRLLRSREATRRIPIVAISGLKDSASVMKALELGATDYCVKPIDFPVLAAKIESICNRFLNRDRIHKRARSTPRRSLVMPILASMPVVFPEKEGLWVESPLDMEEGAPLMVNGSRLFRALRLHADTPCLWSRVEHCRVDTESYQVKLLFESVPENYQEQLMILNRSRDRLRRFLGANRDALTLDFPCAMVDASGQGLCLKGALPWKVGATLQLDLANLVARLGIQTSDTMVRATVMWARSNQDKFIAGVRFSEVEEEFQMQMMSFCIKPGPLH